MSLVERLKATFRRKQEEEPAGPIHLAVDRNGERYTTHCLATNSDPWYGATILTPSVVNQLREEGLLPLTEVEVAAGESL